jgi:hypothetical protein
MRRLMVLVSVLVLLSMACTFSVQTFVPTQSPSESPTQFPMETPTQPQLESQTETPIPVAGQVLEGPDINYNGIRFTLDPALGSRLYVFEDVITLEGATAHNIRFALTPEEFCQTWCLMVYPVAEFEQAFGTFVFLPDGYRGGAAIIFQTQKKMLSFQNGSGDRSLETFGQSHYGVSNESLKYVFRGYSMDHQYGIYVQSPVHASSLPDVAPTMEFNSMDVLDYNQKEAESMNLLTNADFTPDLSLLDAWVASIHVETP